MAARREPVASTSKLNTNQQTDNGMDYEQDSPPPGRDDEGLDESDSGEGEGYNEEEHDVGDDSEDSDAEDEYVPRETVAQARTTWQSKKRVTKENKGKQRDSFHLRGDAFEEDGQEFRQALPHL